MKRLIVLLITFCLSLSMIPVAVFADDGGDSGEVCNLLVLGDSTTDGFGLADNINENSSYAPGNSDLEGSWTLEKAKEYNENNPDARLGRLSEQSYPWKLKKYIESKESVSKCNLNPLCLDGLLSSSVRAMLDPAFYARSVAQERELMGKGEGPVDDRISTYIKNLYKGNTIPEKTYEALNLYTEAEVKKADVIVLDSCMNNISLYLFRRVSGLIGVDILGGKYYYKQKVSDIDGLSDKNRARLKVLKKELLDYIGKADDELTEGVVEAFLYSFADCVTNFAENVKLIRKLNPDAKIIIPGLFKAMRGDKVVMGGKEIDMSVLNEILVKAINSYLRALDDNSPNYYFADTPLDIHTIDDEFIEAESFEDFLASESGQRYLQFLYDWYGDFLFPSGNKYKYKEKIENLFADAIRNYPINMAIFASKDLNLGQMMRELGNYFAKGDTPSESTMMIIHSLAALLVLHPSPEGCDQRYEAIRAAYEKDLTAYEEVLVDVVDAVKAGAANVGIKDISDIQKIIALKDLTSMITKEELLKIAMSIYELPDLEAEIRQYMDEHSGTEQAETQNRIATLEAQVAELTELIEKLTKEDPEKKATLARAKIKSVKSKKKALTVKWKAVANASGYQVSYKASGKKAVVKTVKGAGKLSLKLKKLKKKTKYTVKVRAYRTVDGKKTYGKWSAAKKAKTK